MYVNTENPHTLRGQASRETARVSPKIFLLILCIDLSVKNLKLSYVSQLVDQLLHGGIEFAQTRKLAVGIKAVHYCPPRPLTPGAEEGRGALGDTDLYSRLLSSSLKYSLIATTHSFLF